MRRRASLVSLAVLAALLCGCKAGPDDQRPGVPYYSAVVTERVREAAAQGDPQAQVTLGYWYERGARGQPMRPEEAARLYRLAADQGNPTALTNLAVFHARGRVVKQDDAEAVRLLSLAVRQNDRRAELYLAAFYVERRGGLSDTDPVALAALHTVVDREMRARVCANGWAVLALSRLYETGAAGQPRDLGEAIRLTERVLRKDYSGCVFIHDRDKEELRLTALYERREKSKER